MKTYLMRDLTSAEWVARPSVWLWLLYWVHIREYSGEDILRKDILMLDMDMDVVDELFNYIPEVLDDNYIELAKFILLTSAGDAASTVLMENNNNDENHPNNDTAYTEKEASYFSANTNANVINDNTVVDNEKDDSGKVFPVNILVKAKRGRPPSKPPSREVVKKRRKAANARERRRMDRMNEAIFRYSFALIMPLYLKYFLPRLKQSLPSSQHILSKKQTVDVALEYIVKLAKALDLF